MSYCLPLPDLSHEGPSPEGAALFDLGKFFGQGSNPGASGTSGTSEGEAVSLSSVVAAYINTVENPFAYAPKATLCPLGKPWARKAGSLGDAEKSYVSQRQAKTNVALVEFLDLCNMKGFNASAFVSNISISRNLTIALAVSGGSYRTQFVGAGNLLATDNRYDRAKLDGLGGLMQASTYVTSLSGGSWLVGSLACNDWIPVNKIVDGTYKLWDVSTTFLAPRGLLNVLGNTITYADMILAIKSKLFAGFATSFVDVWGRLLSTQMFTDKKYGISFKWSDVTLLSLFVSHDMPFPIMVSAGRDPGTYVINTNSTVYEFSPYDFASWDPAINSLIDTPYLGSRVVGGTPVSCYQNFDNAGFMIGTSSSVFAVLLLDINKNTLIPKFIVNLINGVYTFLSLRQDVAIIPNPFRGVTNGNNAAIRQARDLNLVDGGVDGQNIPFSPLIHPARQVDIIFAYDNSADTKDHWPDGSAMVNTYLRQFSSVGRNIMFPPVPSNEDFLAQGLTQKQVFFGCYASELDYIVDAHKDLNIKDTDIPLIVYTPNRKYSYSSNTDTYQLQYPEEQRDAMIDNGFDIAANFVDSEFRKCVGCAIIRRTQERNGTPQSEECKACFDRYCWRGQAATSI
ncbi:Lysophospholipase 1 [Scheffersomyces spartinae]|uniref:Lysophospholipase n=1 Tax=Scheffersomyces spartinae TaxID=45513 RepID=A0A9P8AGY3_9ASCO|nr:Lysophospholipase 1 [Scheffersomyces spartinae]KAG7191920.1 Lysophospholipase 1 [Scheffersomyces spartinae]